MWYGWGRGSRRCRNKVQADKGEAGVSHRTHPSHDAHGPAPTLRTLGAALVKLCRRLLEQGVYIESQVELLEIQSIQAGLQGGILIQSQDLASSARRALAHTLLSLGAICRVFGVSLE